MRALGRCNFTYDATGNVIKRGTDTFAYNGYGQLTSATVNGTVAQYKYDINNHRASKTVSGQTTLYLYDNDGRLLSEVDADTGTVNREYIWLGTKPVAYLTGEQVYYIHTDNTETPQLLTNSQGNVVWTVQTYPFGKQSVAGSVTFNLRYPGQYFDAETGLHYNWHRYYDPNTGRYITSDPIGLAGGLNTFAYVGSSPLGRIDPLGLSWQEYLDNSIASAQSETPLEAIQRTIEGSPLNPAHAGFAMVGRMSATERLAAKAAASCEQSFSDFNQARNAAIKWLEYRGFRAEQQTIGKFGNNAGKPIGMKTSDGSVGYRVEFDSRSGPHINTWAGKEKGPHFTFEGNQSTVNKIIKQFE